MAPGRRRLTATDVEAAGPGCWLWDAEVPGLGVRVLASGVRSYVYRYGSGRRGAGRRVTLGQHGELTLDQARKLARRLVGAVAEGRDPALERARARGVPTLAEFSEVYLARHSKPNKRPRSYAADVDLFRLHLLPALGARPLDRLTRSDAAAVHRRMAETPARANRCLALLSHVYTLAHRWGVLELPANPAKGLPRYQEAPRQRYLSAEELARVGAALEARSGVGRWGPERGDSYTVVAIKLLLLTGARRGEVVGLRWRDVDLVAGTARLGSRKAGPLLLYLPRAACELLEGLERRERNPYVFPGLRAGSHLAAVSVTHSWRDVAAVAGCPDVRLHDLRHTWASVLLGRGVSLPVIGGLLGHSSPAMTARYAHLQDQPAREAADGAAAAISAALGKR